MLGRPRKNKLGGFSSSLPCPARPRADFQAAMDRLRTTSILAVLLTLTLGLTAASAQEAEEGGRPKEEPQQQPAPSYGYTLDGNRLEVRTGEAAGEPVAEVALPCTGRSFVRQNARLYIACGADGLYLLSLDDPAAPSSLGMRQLGGTVDDVFVARGQVWAQVARVEALPVDRAVAAAPTPVEPMPTEPEQPDSAAERPAEPGPPASASAESEVRPVGEVVGTRAGTVVIDIGAAEGLKRGDRVELYREVETELGAGETTLREETLAVGRVIAAGQQRSEVELGINEQVETGRLARPTERGLTASNLAPPRPAGTHAVDFSLRPFLALGEFGAGTVSDASYRWAFEWPGLLEVRVDPLGFAIASGKDVWAIAADASLSYDTDVFRIGLGAGFSRIADQDDRFSPDAPENQRFGFNVTQVARLGARDGLHLMVRNSFVVENEEFVYGGTSGQIQVSLDRLLNDTWLLLRGGGHIAGQAFGELGLRVLARGNGGPGTIFLTPSIGGAGVWGSREVDCPDFSPEAVACFDRVSYAGPMVGFSVEWRL